MTQWMCGECHDAWERSPEAHRPGFAYDRPVKGNPRSVALWRTALADFCRRMDAERRVARELAAGARQ